MRILMATGGSLHSEIAIWLGTDMAPISDEAPTILTVISNEKEREHAENVLARARGILKGAFLKVNTKIRIGRSDEEILAEAAQGSYDLIIIGERQMHKRKTQLRGSIAKRVTQAAPCSILLAKGKVDSSIRRILICDSGGGAPSLLKRFVDSEFVKLITPDTGATVLHVLPHVSKASTQPRVDPGTIRRTAEEDIMANDARILAEMGIQQQILVRHGLAADEIQEEARAGDYDLIIIGAHRDAGWQRFLLDDIARKITVQADRPVLVLH